MIKKILLFSFFALNALSSIYAQQVPSEDEKFPFLCTFGKQSMTKWGDDDFSQAFFFVIPENETAPFYIRIFDADNGGKHDEIQGPVFNSKTRFMVFGGKGAHSEPDAQKENPVGNYKKGILLASKTVGVNPAYDNKWITLGPFNPAEGELQPYAGGRVFKVVIDGVTGDDGNLFKMFLSSKSDQNVEVVGGNTFSYEYGLRLPNIKSSACHLYPFISENVVSIKIHIFDYDNDGIIRAISIAKRGKPEYSSGQDDWKIHTLNIVPQEINTSLDIQFIKTTASENNNIVVFITNQYGKMLPFYSAPIGGIPKYSYKIRINPIK